jgi:c-di-AMP phosphodiesterase-like protein
LKKKYKKVGVVKNEKLIIILLILIFLLISDNSIKNIIYILILNVVILNINKKNELSRNKC